MKVNQLFKAHQVISFEVFPPRRKSPSIDFTRIYGTMDALSQLDPDFVSVTFGAGGTKRQAGTLEIASLIKSEYGIEPVAHLPAAQLTGAQVDELLDQFATHGIENILALRGDIPKDGRVSNDFPHANDLVRHICQYGDFNVIGACYPECHPESKNTADDIAHLKLKVDAGATQLISQLFFDNQVFYDFTKNCRQAGINVPIEAGIMPVLNQRQIQRMAKMGGVSLPDKFVSMMARYADNPIAMRDAGIAYAIDQIVDLLVHGVDGIHIYTMDNPTVAKRIVEATRSLVRV
ncbi:methylenetetrahydrofolate reductase [NAD(P)H] [Lacticaseibacillus baoqingensis]|uniref:Methylenetetrahydrofolate reductase n=1 Tax=Lacticaseibacillus baoqingensis TaxID=2486013 RepID=A0ABW4E5I0_9LACO|nr:methylenetetrahydrofolate reductase [NAD(P)H] [Lacticaseibacillus baoqingensis]